MPTISRLFFEEHPLDLAVIVPPSIFHRYIQEDCDCGVGEDSYHRETCAVYGIWADTVRATGIHALRLVGYPTYPRRVNDWKMDGFGQLQWYCSRCERTLGEINGPVHMQVCG